MRLRDKQNNDVANAELRAEERRLEEQRQAPVKAAERKMAETLQAIRETEQQIARQTAFSEPDTGLDAPAYRPEEHPQDTGATLQARCHAAYISWLDGIHEQFELTPAAAEKIRLYVVANPTADISKGPEVFQTLFDRMNYLSLFNDRDIIVKTPPVESEQAPENAPEVESQDIEEFESYTREGEKKARKIVTNDVCSGEWNSTAKAFMAYLAETFGANLTRDQKDAAVDFMRTRNLSFSDARAWDTMRRTLTKRGTLPEGLLTEDEQLSDSLENSGPMGFAEKQRYAREYRALLSKSRKLSFEEHLQQSPR